MKHLSACTCILYLAVSACANPVDVAVELAFAGTYKATDGTVIELVDSKRQALVRTLGSTRFSSPLEVGDAYMVAMARVDADTFLGGVIASHGAYVPAVTVELTNTSLRIERREDIIAGQTDWTRLDPPGSGSGSGSGNCGSAWTCAYDGQATPICQAACVRSGTEREQTCLTLACFVESGDAGECCPVCSGVTCN